MEKQQNTGEIDLISLFSVYLSKLPWIMGAFLTGCVAAGLVTYYLITPLYTASAKLYMVSASSGSAINLTDLSIGTSLSQDYEVLMKIRPIYEEVVEELDLPYTYEKLQSMVTISTISDTRVVTVSAESADAREACDIANAVAQKAVEYLPELMETSTPNIAEKAIVPKNPTSPNLPENSSRGGIAVMLIMMAIITVRYLLDDTLKTSEDIEREFGITPLTIVPESGITKVNLDNMPELPYAVEEAINRLRINTSFFGSKIKTIMIVSAEPNEGKSFIAMNLWRQMAMTGEKCMLLDADLRNSVMFEKYGISGGEAAEVQGTSHYLLGESKLFDMLLQIDYTGSAFLPNTYNVVNPSLLIESERFEKMLEELADKFRYVFVDVPPLYYVSDAEKIGSMCDGAILVVRGGVTSKKHVRDAVNRLELIKCPLLGIVLNRVEGTEKGYYHKYYGQYYGSKKGGKKDEQIKKIGACRISYCGNAPWECHNSDGNEQSDNSCTGKYRYH
jgi:capsular exopolysaccharide synthesis family protein